MPAFIDITGQKIGRLTALEYQGRSHWRFKCDCGNELITKRSDLLRPFPTTSCGCHRREITIIRSTKHGSCCRKNVTRTYQSWQHMVRRCTDSRTKEFKNYGGRGITVCERWRDFSNFLSDMGECPPKLTLERLDNAKGYEPSNCKWATRKEQNRNTRRTKFSPEKAALIRQDIRSQRAIARAYGVSRSAIALIKRGINWK